MEQKNGKNKKNNWALPQSYYNNVDTSCNLKILFIYEATPI